jgi:beta-galactosidase
VISRCALSALLALSILGLLPGSPARANDGIYPPSPAAANVINFDGKGFIINGQRTFIASGGMEYARVPRALWRDRLLRMKRAGFNCTEMYIFWNYHEPTENVWNFTDQHDINAYLQLVHQLGMYAICRIGPYVCAEWDSGGYPVWLRFKPGVVVREDNQPFLDQTFKYYDKIVPIIAANQINHGGAVILVQIENEYPQGWGTDHNSYEEKLREKVLSLGIEVPTFFSGLHHGGDPAGDTPWDDATRINPWMSTEFWCDWYDAYGDTDYTRWIRGAWKILAFGGNGFNIYMLHGGTNFDFYNNNEDASSYDYGAVIGQGGDLRSGYYKFKEAAMFAHTFQSVLENSVSSTSAYSNIVANPVVHEYARTGPSGTIIFLDNPSNQDVTTSVNDGTGAALPGSGPATVPARLMLPIVTDYNLTPTFRIDRSITQILTSVTNGANTTLVVYGPAGGHGSLQLSSPSALNCISGTGWTTIDATHGTLDFTFPADGTSQTIIGGNNGSEKLLVLALNEPAAERTWELPSKYGTDLVVGPDYVGEESITRRSRTFAAESETAEATPSLTILPNLQVEEPQPSATTVMPTAPVLTNWLEHPLDESLPSYNDSNWLASAAPLYMGADGDYSAYAWYRTTVNATTSGPKFLLPTTIRDRMIVFVDGQRVDSSKVSAKSAELDLSAGTHSLAILAVHYGRDKLVPYEGPIDTIDAKGLGAPVSLDATPPTFLTKWLNLPTVEAKPDGAVPPVNGLLWQPVTLGTDVFNNSAGWDWYQTVIPANPNEGTPTSVSVHFDCVDDNGTVYCNGTLVGSHQGWNSGFDVDLTKAWLPGQQNVITVLDENVDGKGGISGNVVLNETSSDSALQSWRMRGGIGNPEAITTWEQISAQPAPAPPAFYQAQFIDSPATGSVAYPVLRVRLGGMSAGFVWLNGHNLGRYPEKIPIDGIYLPDCWLKNGVNTLTVFDEDGNAPTGVNLYTEKAASRYGYTLK